MVGRDLSALVLKPAPSHSRGGSRWPNGQSRLGSYGLFKESGTKEQSDLLGLSPVNCPLGYSALTAPK